MDLLKPGEMGQNMGGEPEKRLRLADRAEWHFEIAESPGCLHRPPGKGKAKAKTIGPVTQGQYAGPERVDSGSGTALPRTWRTRSGKLANNASSRTFSSSKGTSPAHSSNSTRRMLSLPAPGRGRGSRPT